MSLQNALPPHENSLCTFAVFVVANPITPTGIQGACPGYAQLLQDASAHTPTCLYCDLITTIVTPFPEITELVARRHAALDFWQDRLALYFSGRRKALGMKRKKQLFKIAYSLLKINKNTGWVPCFIEIRMIPARPIDLDDLWNDVQRSMSRFEIERVSRPKK